MRDLAQDLRVTLRRLAAAPLFTLLVVATFALGVGANATLFTIFDRLALRPLPVHEPDRLVMLHAPGPFRGFSEVTKDTPWPISHPMFRDLRDRATDLDGVLAYFETPVHLAADGAPERVQAVLVTGTYFPVLGLRAERGRLLGPADDGSPGAHQVAVLAHAFWQARFGGRDDVVGARVRVNGTPMTIVGVAPKGFRGLDVDRSPALFVPVAMKAAMTPTWDRLDDRRAIWLTAFARLAPGVSPARATASVNVLYRQILEAEIAGMEGVSARFREGFVAKRLTLVPGGAGAAGFRDVAAMPLRALTITAGVVLLIACLNVANLLLVRATRRQREIALRLALGARRTRVVRQLVVEGATLAGLGAVAGLGVALGTLPLVVRSLPDPDLQAALSGGLDARLLACALAAAVACAMVTSVAPAWLATRVSLTPALREGSGATAAGGSRLRFALVAAQIGLSIALVFTAGLLGRSLARLAAIPAGFDVHRLVAFSVSPVLSTPDRDRAGDLLERILDQVRALPDVTAVAAAEEPLLASSVAQATVVIPGYEPAPEEDMNPAVNRVSHDFVAAIGATLLAGRPFDARDTADGPRVAMVSRSVARRFFQDDAVGRRFRFGRSADDYEIVGVFSDYKHGSLREPEGRRMVLLPWTQGGALTGATFYARVRGQETGAMAALRDAVRRAAPDLPLHAVRTVEQQRNQSMYGERLSAGVAGAFAGLALLLAGLGLFGTLSHGVAVQLREIGVRLALGAAPGAIVRLVLRQAARVVVAGLLVGIPLAAALARLVRSELFGIAAFDPLAMAITLGTIAITTIAAAGTPAARAAATDPALTLRCE